MEGLTAAAPMPRYKSHKKVWALKITSVQHLGTDTTTDENQLVRLYFEQPFGPQEHNLRGKPTPEAGWYMVQYEDGYVSFSPAQQFEEGYTPLNDEIAAAARAAHEANRILCLALGDASQPKWDDAPGWQRRSAAMGALQIQSHPDTTPEQSHESWLEQKRNDGWQYGPVKNADTKEHPCFVPYSELPEQQRLKDEMFGLVVRASLKL